jgi:hypothetical protein
MGANLRTQYYVQQYLLKLYQFILCNTPADSLLFANTDVSTTKMCLDTSTLAKNSIMGRRE